MEYNRGLCQASSPSRTQYNNFIPRFHIHDHKNQPTATLINGQIWLYENVPLWCSQANKNILVYKDEKADIR